MILFMSNVDTELLAVALGDQSVDRVLVHGM